ncbi:Gfo/Idh/MocA family protein [Pararhizobium haloflavum]|uniref:Gfo/Idh/MocA family protein n=1 Tax=Pararhizobium haloflavum TaxID=2037914 RepID=UPI000C17AF57|nr:Gfo/Idh/MocA family oxidoreductase [Pararhizobium haloflavum]
MFRWGILSTAKIGRDQVIPQLLDAQNCVVTAIASRSADSGASVAERFSIAHVFDSYDALLASDTVDGVYIPLPTSQHVEWAIRAADAGKHVLVEKPLALDAASIDEVIAARERNGVLICEAFMVFYHPQWQKVRSLIAEGAIGTLRHVQGAFTYFNTDAANMRNKVELGGGGLLDIGVYPTVTTRIATGAEPKRIQATIDRDPTFGTDRYASVKADFGAFDLQFYCSTQMSLRQSMVFHGDAGLIEVDAPFNAGDYGHAAITLHGRRHDHAETFRFPGVRQYRLQAEAFVKKLSGEDVDVFTLESSRSNQATIDAIFRAGKHDGWETV